MRSRRYLLVSLISFLLLSSGTLWGGPEKVRARIEAGSLKVKVGEEVTFSAAGSRASIGNELAGYSWDFDDMDSVAVSARGRETTHVFNRTGAYTVQLTVEDNKGGRDSAYCSVEVLPETGDAPSITSHFQGGRTGVHFASEETFAFRLEWGNQFYFRLDNCRGKLTSLRIVGYGPNRKHLPSVTPYGNDNTFDENYTLMYSTDYQRHDWKPYDQAGYTYDSDTATLTASFTPDADSIYFAWAVPWTMRNQLALIEKWEGDRSFTWRKIGHSLEGRPILALTVTDPGVDNREKKAVWVTGTQHAYEMAAGPVIEGMTERLLGGHPDSAELLKKYVYNIVPFMNPDGVFRGGYRYNLHDIDLNRNWDGRKQDDWDSEKSEPEVSCVKKEIDDWVKMYGNLDIFFDFHCLTAVAENLLMIKAAPASLSPELKFEQDRFVGGFLQDRWFFRESDSGTGSGAKGWVSEKYGEPTGVLSFTAEHCLGFIKKPDGEMQRATPELFRRLGRDYVELIDDYFSSTPPTK